MSAIETSRTHLDQLIVAARAWIKALLREGRFHNAQEIELELVYLMGLAKRA